jgi:hypothetical protein
MLTLHGALGSLLPVRRHSNPYRQLIENQGKGSMHRYYVIEDGNHVDSYHDEYPCVGPTALRPISPCYMAAFVELEECIGDEPNNCSINGEATYSPPVG